MSAVTEQDVVSALRPFVVETAAERIADRFVTAIALGEFVVGQRLPTVQELSQRLEVSPNTVREALARLSALGYVEVTRGRTGGTTVVSQWGPDAGDMVHRTLDADWAALQVTLDFRSLVEQQIARTAAQRVEEADAARIRRAVAEYEAAGYERVASGAADHEVHRSIAAAAHNAQLAALSVRIRREVNLGFDADPYSRELRAVAVRQHAELADAVLQREPERAAALAAQHFRLHEDHLRSLRERARPRDDGRTTT